MLFTDVELIAIRHLVLKTANPEDSELAKISKCEAPELRRLIRRHLSMLINQSVPVSKLVELFNQNYHQNILKIPVSNLSPNDIPAPIEMQTPAMILPPKFRGKTTSIPATPTSSQVMSIPVLPRYEVRNTFTRKHSFEPEIGSLAVILYPTLGPAHLCRVIASKMVNDVKYYLVVFFQADHSPCFVSGEYLFQLKKRDLFCLSRDPDFIRDMESGSISVNGILENIFSSAQNLVMHSTDILAPVSRPDSDCYQPETQQLQQIMFQCVSYAALLLLCNVCSEWRIPDDKVALMIATIVKAMPPKYLTTQAYMKNIELLIQKMISLN